MKKVLLPSPGLPLEAARDIASQIPVVEGGPAQRGEPHELVPGAGELEAMPEHSRRVGPHGSGRRTIIKPVEGRSFIFKEADHEP
jgi:hypothetical protein